MSLQEGTAGIRRPTAIVVGPALGRLSRWLGVLLAIAVPPATGEVDALILARARRGDHDASALIVAQYDHRLRALAFRLLGDRDRMDDILQDTYVKAFRSLPRFRGDSGLGTWLYRIAYNACIDDLRRRPALADVSYDPERAVPIADPGAGPADIAVRRYELAAALDGLPADQRAVVMLVDADGLDYAAAAELPRAGGVT